MKNKHHVSIATGTDKSLIRLYYDFMMTYSEFNYQFYWRYFFRQLSPSFLPNPHPLPTWHQLLIHVKCVNQCFAMQQKRCLYLANKTSWLCNKLEQFWQGWVTSVSDLWRWPWPSDWSHSDWHCMYVSLSVSIDLVCYVIKYIQRQSSGV